MNDQLKKDWVSEKRLVKRLQNFSYNGTISMIKLIFIIETVSNWKSSSDDNYIHLKMIAKSGQTSGPARVTSSKVAQVLLVGHGTNSECFLKRALKLIAMTSNLCQSQRCLYWVSPQYSEITRGERLKLTLCLRLTRFLWNAPNKKLLQNWNTIQILWKAFRSCICEFVLAT